MTPLAAVKLPEGVAVPIPGLSEGAVGDVFSDLLGTLDGGPAPALELANPAAAAPIGAQPADNPLAPLAALIAAVKTLATPHKAAAGEPAEDAGAEADPDGTKPDQDAAQPATVSLSPTPPAIALAATAAAPATAMSPPAIPQRLEQPPQAAPVGVPTPAIVVADQPDATNAPQTLRQADNAPAPAQHLRTLSPTQANPFLKIVGAMVPPHDTDNAAWPATPDRVAPLSPALTPTIAQPAPLPALADTATAPAEAIDHSVSQHLDLAHQSEWLDQLAGEIARTAGKSGVLRFRLHPETLGRLHVEMSQGAAGASIRLTADTETARAIIADAQPRLVAEARAQGVRIAETHVGLGTSGQWSSTEQQGQRGTNPEWFLRTSGAERGEGEAAARPNSGAAERYA
ncbi:MAG TPA: flagellar hook-length control protein FliK [Sphingomicrobium sp.]|nr:flagellar hook-length control protein FliK [Sphingomicrobium sp.]